MKTLPAIAILFLIMSVFHPLPAFTDSSAGGGRLLLLSEYAQVREMRDRAEAEIVRLVSEIAKNEASIGRAQKIVALARQRSDPQARRAEAVARRAWEKAAAAQRANELARKQWQFAKVRSEAAGAAIRGLLAQGADAASGVRGMLTARSGAVSVTKADGREAGATEVFLEKGDRLRVEDGRAELKVLDGRCVVVAGSGTEVLLAEDSSTRQVLEQIGGNAQLAVEKAEAFAERMGGAISRYWDDLRTIAGADKAEIEAALKQGKRWFEWRFDSRRHAGMDKITAVVAVRGTRFNCDARTDGGLDVTVMEGEVDVTIPETGQSILLAAGEKGTVAADGTLHKEKIMLPDTAKPDAGIPDR